MADGKINVADFGKIADNASWSPLKKYIESAASGFHTDCYGAATRGMHEYTGFAKSGYNSTFIFTDKNSLKPGRREIYQWADYLIYPDEELDVSLIDEFMEALEKRLKEEGFSDFYIEKYEVENPPTVRRVTCRWIGSTHENVPVPSWYIRISARW